MKNIKILLSILLVGSFLVGCDALGGSVSDDQKYAALDSLMSNPNPSSDIHTNKLSGQFTFSAYAITESEEWDLDGVTHDIVVAMISRNVDDYLLISVNGIEDYDFPEGSYISVTGELAGSIYWTVENEKVEALHIEASKIEVLEPTEIEPKEDATFTLETEYKSGTISFGAAQATTVIFNQGVNLYYEFENTTDKDNGPFFDGLMFYQGDVLLTTTIMSGDAPLHEGAIKGDFTNTTPAGKTESYYSTFDPKYSQEEMNAVDPIEVIQYDDDFNVIQVFVLELE